MNPIHVSGTGQVMPVLLPYDVFDAVSWNPITANEDGSKGIRWGAVRLEGHETGVVWRGGFIKSLRPLDASWAEHKATENPDDPARNSAAVEVHCPRCTITGVSAYNVHDGFRFGKAPSWTLQDSIATYIRDDAIECDLGYSGTVSDVLIDGAYVLVSTRTPKDGNAMENGGTITLDGFYGRIESMPWPYKWDSKPCVDQFGYRYKGIGIPYGHGPLFKTGPNDQSAMRWRFRDVVIAAEKWHPTERLFNLPPRNTVDEVGRVRILWSGVGPWPGDLSDWPEVELITGPSAREAWDSIKRDWYKRHILAVGEFADE